MIEVSTLCASEEEEWDAFLRGTRGGLLYHSIAYRNLLVDHLGCEAEYLVAREGGEIRGVLPMMWMDDREGWVCNSLPFFGSHGGPVASDRRVERALLDAWDERAADAGTMAATMVANPFLDHEHAEPVHEMRDERIGHYTVLPGRAGEGELMALVSREARSNVRKAERRGVSVEFDTGALDEVCQVHQENMGAVGVPAKSADFFAAIPTYFHPGEGFDVWIARLEDEVVAALLVFRFNGVAEYFTSGTYAQHRSDNPHAALLLAGMVHASECGCRLWNWGGTGVGQESLYRFKAKWGARHRRYRYFTRVNDRTLLEATPEELLARFPRFYVLCRSPRCGETLPGAAERLRLVATRLAGRVANRAIGPLVPAAAAVALTILAACERPRTAWRRWRGRRPRLIWGPVPIISLKYWSAAMMERGYESSTCVSGVYAINERADFDLQRGDFLGPSALSERLRSYAMFAWSLRNGDVFLRFLDGGFLRGTPLQWYEYRLLRVAGKKLVVSPYGSDIAVAGHLGALEEPLFADYPGLARDSELTERWVNHSVRWADLVVRNHQFGFLPSFDVVWPCTIGIDVERWQNSGLYSRADGRRDEVVVLHAPNHRNVKGTRYLEEAVSELRAEGLRVRLELLERRSNEEVRQAMLGCDIVADGFRHGYAIFAVEGMATGKPVLSRLSSLASEFRARPVLKECPIVDADPASVRAELRRLVEDPDLREELGRAGREFVLRHHSNETVGGEWEAIVEHVWSGRGLPDRLLPGEADEAHSPEYTGGPLRSPQRQVRA